MILSEWSMFNQSVKFLPFVVCLIICQKNLWEHVIPLHQWAVSWKLQSMDDQNESFIFNPILSEKSGLFLARHKRLLNNRKKKRRKDADVRPPEYQFAPLSPWYLWWSPLHCSVLHSPALKVQTRLTGKQWDRFNHIRPYLGTLASMFHYGIRIVSTGW